MANVPSAPLPKSFLRPPALHVLLHALLLALLCALLLAPAGRALAQVYDDEIVTIDPQGFIRVRDPATGSGAIAIGWFSPVGGYVNAALVDANRDGDMEIVGLRSVPDATPPIWSVDIYDPVVASGAVNPDQTIAGIPWALLYSLPLEREPVLVAVGELDHGFPGAEILVTARLPNTGEAGRQELFFLHSSGNLDGRAWERVSLSITGENWTSMTIGNMDAAGTDEVALVQRDRGILEVWRVNGASAQRIYENESNDRRWQHAAFGEWRGDGRQMLGAVRRGGPGFATFVIFRYSLTNGEIRDDFTEVFLPFPHYLFFGDVNGSGEDEVFLLRDLPASETTRARLIGRNRGDDPMARLEDPLTPDNGYRVGAAGDIDGDGRAEIVLARSDGLRLFASPEVNNSSSSVALATDARTLLIGDLDRNGYILPLRFAAAPTTLSLSAPSGGPVLERTLALTTEPVDAATPWSVQRMATAGPGTGAPPTWLGLQPPGGATPEEITLTIDPSRLRPGTYSANLSFGSSNPHVYGQPLVVPVTLSVTDGLLAEPGAFAFHRTACAPSGGPSDTRSVSFTIVAPQGTTYQASLIGAPTALSQAELVAAAAALGPPTHLPDAVVWPSSVPWASATSAAGAAVEPLTVTIDYAQRTADFAFARLVIVATVDGSLQVRTVPISILCAADEILLPLIFSR